MQNFRLRLIKKERLRRSLRPEFSHVAAWLSLLVSAFFFFFASFCIKLLTCSVRGCVQDGPGSCQERTLQRQGRYLEPWLHGH